MIAGTLFSVFPILIFIAFFIILIKTIIDSKNNSKLPRLTVEAIVISKKEDYLRAMEQSDAGDAIGKILALIKRTAS